MRDRRSTFDSYSRLVIASLALACTPSSNGGRAMGGRGAGGAGSGGALGAGNTGSGGSQRGSGGTMVGLGGRGGMTGGSGGTIGGGGAGAGGVSGTAAALRIYWIDTEGGASTVMAMPDGQVLVVDAGFTGTRDAQRTADVVKNELGASRIDVMVVTHYHIDHVGGVPTLAGLVPIARYFDHGDAVETGSQIDAYVAMFSGAGGAGKRSIVKPGDTLTFGPLELTFVTAAGAVIDPPLATAVPNNGCANATSKSDLAGAENPQSVGFVARFGKFDFIDLGDLTWDAEQKLVCPTNRVGVIDLYQVNHHGMDLSSSPQLVYALAPLVAVMNNGASKGGAAAAFEVIKAAPGLQDLWSLHRVTANDAAHNADEALTANTDTPDRAYWIKAVIDASGKFTLTNGRTGLSRSYQAR